MTLRRHRPGGRGPLTPATAVRIAALGTAALVLMGVLMARLWFLQIIGGQAYAQRAEANRIRTVDLPAQRGTITDRNGKVLARVREGWNIVARPLELPNPKRQLVVRRLAEMLGTPPRPMLKALAQGQQNSPYEAVVLEDDVPLDIRTAFVERQRDFPGVAVERSYVRTYPDGELAAHVLGTVGPIYREHVTSYRDQGYLGNETVGHTGIEAQYESYLRGTRGELRVEVNVAGQPVGRGILSSRSPTPGNTLVLSLDAKLQAALQAQLYQRVEGSAATGAAGVAMNPQTGEVLAMASYPTFNPEDYARSRVKRLTAYQNSKRQPLTNRADEGLYPPASTMKIVTLASALQTGIVKPGAVLLSDSSVELWGRNWINFGKEYQGYLSLPQALEQSSDTIFYGFGDKFFRRYRSNGVELQQRWAHDFGLGQKTGIDLPDEADGRIPDKQWKRTYPFPDGYQRQWLPGDNINMAVGQGDVLVTPLQMAVAYSVIANGGHRVVPTLGKRIETPAGSLVRQLSGTKASTPVTLSPSTLSIIREGLRGVTSGPGGTATGVFGPVPLKGGFAGKTGTGENYGREDHSWFVGYAPADNPKIVVAIVVANGGTGASAAAPAVCATMGEYLGYDPGLCGVAPPKKTN